MPTVSLSSLKFNPEDTDVHYRLYRFLIIQGNRLTISYCEKDKFGKYQKTTFSDDVFKWSQLKWHNIFRWHKHIKHKE